MMDKCIDSDDIVYSLAAFLPPKDLVSLALTCKSFGYADANNNKTRLLAWSRMEEVARRQVSAAKDDTNFKWRHSDLLTIDGRESWITVYNRLNLLRTSIIFHTLINGDITYVNKNVTHIQAKTSRSRRAWRDNSYAICQQTINFDEKKGKHFIQFRIKGRSNTLQFGIMRPIHSNKRKRKMKITEYNNLCNTEMSPHKWHYSFVHNHFSLCGEMVYGLLLDLETRQLNAYRNHECVKTINLHPTRWNGPFCWAVSMKSHPVDAVSVQIDNYWQDNTGDNAVGPIPKENWETWNQEFMLSR